MTDAPSDTDEPVLILEELPPAPVATQLRSHDERQALHASELKRAAQTACGTTKIRTQLDASRGIWQAWAGDTRFADAELRGEWTTELGSIRRLRNVKTRIQDAERRPLPSGGSTQLIDAIAKRQHDGEKKSSKRSGRWLTIAIVLIVLLVNAMVLLTIFDRYEPEPRQPAPRAVFVEPQRPIEMIEPHPSDPEPLPVQNEPEISPRRRHRIAPTVP